MGIGVAGRPRDDGLCRTLVVEEVLPNGFARVIYSHGTYEAWNVRLLNFWRASGRIVDGVLRLQACRFPEVIPTTSTPPSASTRRRCRRRPTPVSGTRIPDMFTRVARGAPIEDTMNWGVGEIRRIYARHKAV